MVLPKVYESNHVFDIMRNLNRERLSGSKHCDITFTAGSRDFRAHKCVMRTFSRFYNKVVKSVMQERHSKRIPVQNVSSEILDIILNFIYTCKVIITNENVFELLNAAEYMEIPYLKGYCIQSLLHLLDVNNCFELRNYAIRNSYDVIVSKANEIIRENFEKIAKDESFNELQFDEVFEIINFENKQVSSEDIICQAILGWVKHDIHGRKMHFESLFELLELKNMSGLYLRNVVFYEKLIADSPKLLKMTLDSLLPQDIPTEMRQTNQAKKGFLAVKGQQAFIYNHAKKMLQKLPNMKFDHKGGSVVNLNEEIYAISGEDNNSVEKLSLNDVGSGWLEVASTNIRRDYSASTVLEDKIYTFGGWCSASATSSGEIFDRHCNKWKQLLKTMSEKRRGHALVSVNAKLYALGGYDDGRALNCSECWDPLTGEDWMMLPRMKRARRGFASVVLDGKIYVIGGWDFENLDSVERFDPINEIWIYVASLNQARRDHGACVFNGKIYVAGGQQFGTEYSSIEVYNSAINEWDIVADFGVLEGPLAITAI